MKRKAIIIGGSGRVGQALVRELSALYDTLIIITRTQPRSISENMHVYHVNNFDALADTIASMPIGADTDAFSCLGAAKKDTASQDEFYQVNVLFNIAFAKACRDKGVSRFFYLSKAGVESAGKDAELIAKADVEYYLKTLKFDDVTVFRLHKLSPAKEKLSLKTAGKLSLNLARNTIGAFMPFDKTEMLMPKRVAAAMSLAAYRLNLRSKYRTNEENFHVISHDKMCAMTEKQTHH